MINVLIGEQMTDVFEKKKKNEGTYYFPSYLHLTGYQGTEKESKEKNASR